MHNELVVMISCSHPAPIGRDTFLSNAARAAESRNSDHTRTMAVPQQMQMGGGNGFPALAGPNLFVKQTKRGCLQVE